MSEPDWSERFPDLRPVRSAPALVRVNGIGCGIYGSRDHDAETGTYVSTYCFCFLFIPVVALTAYRVANSPSGGWYFLGRVPLSTFARTWNVLVLLAILAGVGAIGWNSYTTSPDYVASQRLAEADRLAVGGQISKAASLYRDVATGRNSHASTAIERLQGLLDDPALHTSLKEAAGVYRVVLQVKNQTGMRVDVEERGLKLIDEHGDQEPRDALVLLDVLQPAVKDAPKLAARRQSLLERAVQRDPRNVALASELARLYEANHQLPRCEKLLLPLKDRLGDSAGARILGQILARKDKVEDACAVLEPYTDKKLQELHAAEQADNQAMEQLRMRMQSGSAVGFPYPQLRAADDAGKRKIVSEYVANQLKTDPSLKQTHEAYERACRVVPAALDLGQMLLRRAQMRRDPAVREADLKKAEKVFLGIQNEAAGANRYRLSLGQVYYWLGKSAEGRKQFDELLAAEKRSPQALLEIASVLREVGERSQACTLLEEAYNKEAEKDMKFQAASLRSSLAVEVDDKITWLQRSSTSDPAIKARLQEAHAQKALEEGKPAEAEPYLRQAIALYAKMPESDAVLNNAALAHMTLYRATGERSLLETAVSMMEKAVALNPGNSILVRNAVVALLDAAVRDVIGPSLDLAALKRAGDRSLLSFLYDDADGKRRLTEQFCSHPATIKATTFLERLLILSPKTADVYRQLVSLYEDQSNLDKLRDLAARLQRGTLDLADEEKRTRELWAGKRAAKSRKDLQGQLGRSQERADAASKGPRGATYAVAVTDLVQVKMGLVLLGGAGDREEIVRLAESAYKAAPSIGTRWSLESALLLRASDRLARKDAAYAAIATRTGRFVSPADLIAAIIEHGGKLRSLALADPDVQRTQELIREGRRKFPDMSNAWAWAMLQADESEANKLARVIRADTLDDLVRTFNVRLDRLNNTSSLRRAWALRAAGKDKEAEAILKESADRGVPLPRLP